MIYFYRKLLNFIKLLLKEIIPEFSNSTFNELYMSPAKWIRQAEWITIANIHFFLIKNKKKINVRICNPTIFALHILGVKLCFHP